MLVAELLRHALPGRARRYFELGRTQQFDKLFTAYAEFLAMVEDFLAPTRHKSLMDGAYDKMIVRLAGIDFPPRLLSPYEWFPEEVYEQCRRVVEEKYGDWR